MKLNSDSINHHLELVKKAKQDLDAVIKKEQELCKHQNIAECPYKPETCFMYTQAPIRVCLDCGLTEEGWSGHKILKETTGLKPREIDRDVLYQLRQGEMITK